MLDILESFLRIMSAAKAEIQALEYEVAQLKRQTSYQQDHLRDLVAAEEDKYCDDRTQVFNRADLKRQAGVYKSLKSLENKSAKKEE